MLTFSIFSLCCSPSSVAKNKIFCTKTNLNIKLAIFLKIDKCTRGGVLTISKRKSVIGSNRRIGKSLNYL